MSPRKNMILLSIVILIVLFAIMVGVWWHVFFGTPNAPLPQATVSVQGPQSSSTASASAATSSATSSSVVDGENPPLPSEALNIDAATFTVEIASTSLEQTRGLSFRPSLGANDGMLFIFTTGSVQSFWMKDMNFPLDMIWISGTTVVGFAQNVPAPAPGTAFWNLPVYISPGTVDKVLEVNAGTVAKYNIRVGDSVTIEKAASSSLY